MDTDDLGFDDFDLPLPAATSFLMQAKLEGLYTVEEEDEYEKESEQETIDTEPSDTSAQYLEDEKADQAWEPCSPSGKEWSKSGADRKSSSPMSILDALSESTLGASSCHTDDFAGPEEKEVEVAIVGGGLGGLALAVGLRRRGFDAHVFEAAATGTARNSWPLNTTPEGLRALAGIYPRAQEAVAACSIQLEKATVSRVGCPGETIHSYPVLVQQGDALQAFTGLLPYEAVHFSHTFRRFENLEGGVEAHFAVTAPEARTVIVRAKLLVGADGCESLVRRQLAGPEEPSPARAFLCWTGVAPVTQSTFYDYPKPGVGEHVHFDNNGLYSSMIRTGPGQVHWQVCKLDSEGKLARSFGDYGEDWGGRGQWGAKGRVLQFLGEEEEFESLRKAISTTGRGAIAETRVLQRPFLHKWADESGRVVLLGDAAEAMCPVRGNGGMLALEDALELGQALEDAVNLAIDANVTHAVYRYETLRIARRQQVARQLAAKGLHQRPSAESAASDRSSFSGPIMGQHSDPIIDRSAFSGPLAGHLAHSSSGKNFVFSANVARDSFKTAASFYRQQGIAAR